MSGHPYREPGSVISIQPAPTLPRLLIESGGYRVVQVAFKSTKAPHHFLVEKQTKDSLGASVWERVGEIRAPTEEENKYPAMHPFPQVPHGILAMLVAALADLHLGKLNE